MEKRWIKDYDRDEFEWGGIMRLVEGVVLHVLDQISITKKWTNKDISMRTLLAKKKTLKELREWMRGWQWSIWVNIYAEHNRYNNHQIKRKFELIRKKSVRIVNKRIHEKESGKI